MGQQTSEVSICNQALGWLGLDPIISLSDPSKSAQLCLANFAPLRDSLLEAVDWTFAQKRAELAQSAAAPIWGYSARFDLPIDCLRIGYATASPDIYESQPLSQWVKEGRSILTNESAVFIRYTAQVTDPKEWSEGFSQALAARLASDIAMAATESRGHMETMFQLYETKLAQAKTDDGRQGTSQKVKANDLKRVRQ